MSKKINLRFLLYSLAGFAVLGAGLALLHKWQVQRQLGIYLAKAREAESGGKIAKASELYTKYLALAQRDAAYTEAQSQYGSLLLNARAYNRASQMFEAVLRRDPGRSDIRRKAVKADMAGGRVPDARDHLEHYLLKEFPDDAELLDLEGRCLAQSGEYLAAGRSFITAIERDPARVAAYAQLIAILSGGKDPDKVPAQWFEDLDKDREQWLALLPHDAQLAVGQDKHWAEKSADYWTERLVASNPKDPHAYILRGDRRCRKQLYQGAIQDAEAALTFSPDDTQALHLAATSCLAAQQLDKAHAYAAKAAPKDPQSYEILAQIDLSRHQPDEALKWLQEGVQTGPPQLWWSLGILQIAQGKYEAARQTAQGLRKKVFPMELQPSATQSTGYPAVHPELYADLLEAKIEEAQGHWREATQRFGQVGIELKSAPGLAREAFYGLGKCYEQLGDAERALAAYRQALDAEPMSIPVRQAVAANLAALGRIDEALEAQSTLTRLNGAPLTAWVDRIRWSISRASSLPADKRDWSAVADLLNQFANSFPQSAAGPVLRAELLIAQDRAAEAEGLLEAAGNKDPKEIAYWVALVDLAIRRAIHDQKWDRAGQTLQEAEKELGDRVALRIERARYLTLKGEQGAAEQLRKLAEKSNEFSTPEQVQLWRVLLSASLAVNDAPQAERLCRLLMPQLPNDLHFRYELLDVAARADNVTLMDTALNEIGRIEGSGPIWHYAKALRLVLSNSVQRGASSVEQEMPHAPRPTPHDLKQAALQQALDHLAEALRLRPNWPQAVLLEGLVYEESHQEDAALARYMEAIRQGENSPDVARRALRLLYGKGEYAAANALLRQLEGQQVAFTTELFREQSRVLGMLQDYAGALTVAQKAAADSKDYRDYLWLGQLLGILGRREEAEKALQQASLLDAKAPGPWVALVEFFARTDQKDRAEKALASAREQIPPAEAPLALARCLEALGKADEAGQQYVLALKQRPGDPNVVRNVAVFYVRKGDLPKAAEELVRIVSGQVPATNLQIAEARRDLARIRAQQGGYQNLLEAIRLVDLNLAAQSTGYPAPSSADNLRLKADFLAIHPELAKRREALAIFEKLVEDPKLATAEDRLRLARLYLAAGDWTKARPQMLALLATHGNQLPIVAAYARALLDHKEIAEAETWIDRLEQIAPGNPQAAQMRADVQFRAGKIDEVLTTLTKFVEQAPAGSADRLDRMLGAAGELESMASAPGDTAGTPAAATAQQKAEELYRQYVKEDPQQGLVLVGFLGRQKRFDEALKLAEEACKTAEPMQIAASCEALLLQPGISPVQIERTAEILAAALKKHDRAVPLQLVMAGLLETQEKYPEAESLYREILREDKDSVQALNNLAGLLTLRGRPLDEAKNLVDNAIAVAGPQPYLLDTRASVYLAMGQADKALAEMQGVLAEQPAPNRYFHLALVLQKLGRRAEATDSLVKARAMQLRPESLHPLERPAYAELVRVLLEPSPSGKGPG